MPMRILCYSRQNSSELFHKIVVMCLTTYWPTVPTKNIETLLVGVRGLTIWNESHRISMNPSAILEKTREPRHLTLNKRTVYLSYEGAKDYAIVIYRR